MATTVPSNIFSNHLTYLLFLKHIEIFLSTIHMNQEISYLLLPLHHMVQYLQLIHLGINPMLNQLKKTQTDLVPRIALTIEDQQISQITVKFIRLMTPRLIQQWKIEV